MPKFEQQMHHRKRSIKNNIGSIYRGSSPLNNLNAQCLQQKSKIASQMAKRRATQALEDSSVQQNFMQT